MRVGRTAQWPNYFEKSYSNKKLAILEGSYLYVEDTSSIQLADFSTLLTEIFNQNLLLFVPSLTSKAQFPFLADCIYYDGSEVICNKDGIALAIRVNGPRNASRWIIPSSTWDRRIGPTFLEEMHQIYAYYKVGTKPTPGSLGRSVLRRFFFLNNEPRHTAPNVIALVYLREHGYGGRCDTMVAPFKETGYVYEKALSLDMASGYLAHFMKLPDGTSRWFLNGNVAPYFTYFCECDVTIHKELALGPFPMRTGRKGSKIVYPTLPGVYHTFLWKEQIEDAKNVGCTVSVGCGVGWRDYTTCTADFCKYMHHSRIAHTGLPIEDDDKKIAVSTIGGFGMKQTFYRLTGENDERFPCVLDDDHNPLDYYVMEYTDYKQPSMLHWREYCIMQCNRSLYLYALPYAEVGRLIMTNYDELVIIAVDEQQRYARKHSLEALMCRMGDLRWQELTNVKIHGDRSLDCDQKTVRPGVPRIEEAV